MSPSPSDPAGSRRISHGAWNRNSGAGPFVGLSCLAPKVLDALKILQPETVICWHQAIEIADGHPPDD